MEARAPAGSTSTAGGQEEAQVAAVQTGANPQQIPDHTTLFLFKYILRQFLRYSKSQFLKDIQTQFLRYICISSRSRLSIREH